MAEDTPPTGTAIPRPRPKPEGTVYQSVAPMAAEPIAPTPPRTVEDIFELINKRLPPEITARISSIPAPAPRQSMPVRAAKATPKLLSYVLSGVILLGQIIASAAYPEYRGPIVQAGKIILLGIAEAMKEDPAAPPAPASDPE